MAQDEGYAALEEAALRARYRKTFEAQGKHGIPACWRRGRPTGLRTLVSRILVHEVRRRASLNLGNFVVLMFPPSWGDSAEPASLPESAG